MSQFKVALRSGLSLFPSLILENKKAKILKAVCIQWDNPFRGMGLLSETVELVSNIK